MYVLAKFQLCILKAFENTALQSNSHRKIDLYSKHRENNLQALPKTDVTIDYLDYVPGIGNARFIWIIRVGAHPNNS